MSISTSGTTTCRASIVIILVAAYFPDPVAVSVARISRRAAVILGDIPRLVLLPTSISTQSPRPHPRARPPPSSSASRVPRLYRPICAGARPSALRAVKHVSGSGGCTGAMLDRAELLDASRGFAGCGGELRLGNGYAGAGAEYGYDVAEGSQGAHTRRYMATRCESRWERPQAKAKDKSKDKPKADPKAKLTKDRKRR
ncbi:hypothetical protein B0H14DRAFT_3472124 [Mycena olivaceomarginata]|nr:hypothetical protein B0H14DRAFT_3472124 [Mycena olivaceomarginata]